MHFFRDPLLFTGLLVLLIAACDQVPDVDERPAIFIRSPERFSSVFTKDAVPLRVQARSDDVPRVDRLTLNGQPMTYDEATGLWTDSLRFAGILNRFVLEAYLDGERVDRDTAYAAYLDYSIRQAAPLQKNGNLYPRGGHTATRLADGRLLIAGGTANAALPEASKHSTRKTYVDGERIMIGSVGAGHTATRLPDGQVLFLGGSYSDPAASVSDLVTTVRLYDPDAEEFWEIPVQGAPVRRTLHTADLRLVDGEPVIDVFGGRGDVGTGRLEVRGDLRRFVFRNDTLIAVDPNPGLALRPDPVFGHTQTALRASSSGHVRYLVAGTNYLGSDELDASFLADLTSVPDFRARELPRFFKTQRTRHAAVRLGEGLVLLMGGYQFRRETALSSVELYVDELKQTFLLELTRDEATLFGPRYGHTAIRRGDGQVLIIGGFSRTGIATALVSLFEVHNVGAGS